MTRHVYWAVRPRNFANEVTLYAIPEPDSGEFEEWLQATWGARPDARFQRVSARDARSMAARAEYGGWAVPQDHYADEGNDSRATAIAAAREILAEWRADIEGDED